jgi:FAD/FMN-containing dehydrogenase
VLSFRRASACPKFDTDMISAKRNLGGILLSRRSLLRAGGVLGLAAAASGGALPAFGAGWDWHRLRDQLQGDLVLPADSGYALAKQVEFAEYDAISPAGIAYCETPADVRACIRFAQDYGIEVRPRSGGHSTAGWSTGQGLIVDTSRLNAVTVGSSTVSIGPGAQSVDAIAALKPYGKQVMAGTCPTVCPGGFLSGGGVGFQTRKFGVGSDRLVSAQVVLADGRIVRCSATQEPELFWALRGGGGGNFGVVVDFEVRPIDAPTMAYFSTYWPWEQAQQLLAAWQSWTISSTDDLCSQLIMILPDAVAGSTPIVWLRGGYFGPQPGIEAALADLAAEAGVQPTASSVRTLPYDEAMMHVYGCESITQDQCHRVGHNPDALLARVGFGRQRNRLFSDELSTSGLAGVLTAYDSDRRGGHTRYLSFTGLGGAANRVGRQTTAYVHRDSEFLVSFGTAIDKASPPPDDVAVAEAWTDRGFAALDPHSNGESYINFPDMRLANWQAGYYGQNYARLLRAKSRYDPGNFFRNPRSIGSP